MFAIGKIPSDNHIRDMLDPAEPALLDPVFAETLGALERRAGGLASFRRLGDHVLIALDGTEYFRSKTIHCPNCSTRLRGKAGKEYFHAMLGTTMVATAQNKVVPLQPEFIVPQDGAEKQDCENAAAKRWLAAHAASYARLNPIYLGNDLFSRQPLCEAVLAAGSHFIFVCKPSSHPLIAEYLTGIEPATPQDRVPQPILQQSRGHHHFIDLSLLARPATNFSLRKTTATLALTPAKPLPPKLITRRSTPTKSIKCQNENCWFGKASSMRWLKIREFEYLIIDSTIVRAHQHAAGAKKGGAKMRRSGVRAAA